MRSAATNETEIRTAYAEYDREQTISNFKVACVLGMLLMPAGMVLDYAVYEVLFLSFAQLRFLCSLLIGLFLGILLTPFGNRYYRFLGVTLFSLPASFIAYMIYYSFDGPGSPYYAGLYLVLLVLAFVLHWTFRESLTAAVLVLVLYFTACGLHIKYPPQGSPEVMKARAEWNTRAPSTRVSWGVFVNNLYFLSLTGIIVVTGSYFHSKSRRNEFRLRYQLDRSRVDLENANQELAGAVVKLRTAQHQLVEAEKQKSLGILAGGIIHNIGNTLTHVRTNLFTLRRKSAQMAPEQAAVFGQISDDMELGIKQAMSTIQQVRIYTHPNTEVREDLAVAELVESAALFTASAWREAGIGLEQRLAAGQTIRGNRQSLIDVLVNLILNSVDALKAKAFSNGDPPVIRIESLLEGGRSLIRVADNGMGIDPAIQGRVFDPYFTTKDIGQGTGLGLPTCKATVEQYGGRIHLRTEVGKFTEITLDFPANELS